MVGSAARIREKSLGPDDPWLANTLADLADDPRFATVESIAENTEDLIMVLDAQGQLAALGAEREAVDADDVAEVELEQALHPLLAEHVDLGLQLDAPRAVVEVQEGHAALAAARVQAVKHVRANVDARDNASVLLRDPRAIEFGTIFLAGLRSDEAMISVLAHELTHVASGQTDSLRPLFRAIARRAAARTGLRIQGQRAEELGCDLVGLVAARDFIKQTPSWEPHPRRVARAVEHNCVDDDSSDVDHLSPRNTIRALFSLDVDLARELLASVYAGNVWKFSIPALKSIQSSGTA